MGRISNKKLHAQLWTWAHFLGSALVFLLVVASVFYFEWKVGVYSGNQSDLPNNSTLLNWSGGFVGTVINEMPTQMFPIYNVCRAMFSVSYDSCTASMVLFTIAVAFDLVLYFNLFLWSLQFIVFIPDYFFHYLESKKGD